MTFEHGYAVVIGVHSNQIERLALPTVAKDVEAVYEVLAHPQRCAYDKDNVKLLSGADATERNILDALDWLNEKVSADPDATAVIYYSGHGWLDEEKEQYHLIPYDMKDPLTPDNIRAYSIPAEKFNTRIAGLSARRMLAVLDCCHSAGMGVKAIDESAIDSTGIGEMEAITPAAFPLNLAAAKAIPEYKDAPGSKNVIHLLEGEGRAILNSSTGLQKSWTRSDGRMSIFTYHFIEALTGHAPHPDDATVVYVTDVMSWVTHNVKKSAAKEGVEQTPVMKTSGVFPIAQLIGGKGVAKSLGQTPPDPLQPLPQTNITTTFNQEGQTVSGKQTNIGTVQGNVGQIGDNYGDTVQGNKIETGGGDYVGGDKVGGDKVGGDKVGGDKYEGINISGAQGSSIAFGRGSQATVTTTYEAGGSGDNLTALFAPLQQLVGQEAPTLTNKVNALKKQVALGSAADDKVMAGLVLDLADTVPAVKSELARLFKNPKVEKAVGPRTEFALERL